MATETEAAVRELCDDFTKFAGPIADRFAAMSKHELYRTAVSDSALIDLFERYLAAFPEGTNPMFRERTEHDCSTCKQFVRRLGGLVILVNGRRSTVWEIYPNLPEPYRTVAKTMDALVRQSAITTVFRTKERNHGCAHNHDPKTTRKYVHFHGKTADRHFSQTPDTARSAKDSIFQVMGRGLSELKPAHLDEVLDLIQSNGLYRGEEFKPQLEGFRKLKQAFDGRDLTADPAGDLFVWENLGHCNAEFRNTVIGTLLVDLAEGREFEEAVRAFEKKVAPDSYKRPTSVITQKMVEDAVQTLTDEGLHGALARRYARLTDVSVTDVLFVDNDVRGKMKNGVAALLEGSVRKATPDLKHAVTMPADEFVKNVLPGTRTLDVFVENRHVGNFVSLTGSDDPTRLFKWDNVFAWSYDGDLTDSVKQRVKSAGGKIDCKMRVSLSWYNYDDLDLHAVTPGGHHVYFANKMSILDVDMNAGGRHVRNAVENLAFNSLRDGVYKIYVHQFSRRETVDYGFAIEVEFGGQLYQHSYAKAMANKEDVPCFNLHVKNGELVKVETTLTGGSASQEKWGVKTETLVPVASLMYSPNHWGESKVGARHLIFALQGCKNPEPTRGFYNEFLGAGLERHRKVFEVLASKTKCPHSDEQVSGVGFTAARGDSVTVVVDGKRAHTLQF